MSLARLVIAAVTVEGRSKSAVARDYGVYWSEWNANNRATFIVDGAGTIRFIERYGRGQLPDPDKILAEVKKL